MWAVAVHIGAGRHAADAASTALAEASMRDALETAGRLLRDGASATTAATAAVRVLEDAACTNAGSNGPCVNLTETGVVETDASIVDGHSGGIGCVGAVHGVRNPIELAAALLRDAATSRDDGRTPPMVLVGAGALEKARALELELVDYAATPINATALRKHASMQSHSLDTVGAVVVDAQGHMAAAASSAGIALKAPGRVGPAGCPRMGCIAWSAPQPPNGYAWAGTGRGEDMMRTGLLQQLEGRFRRKTSLDTATIDHTTTRAFNDAAALNNDVGVEGGVLGLLRSTPTGHGASRKRRREGDAANVAARRPATHVVAAFTTPSMGIGIYCSDDSAPRAQIVRSTEKDILVVQVLPCGAKDQTANTLDVK